MGGDITTLSVQRKAHTCRPGETRDPPFRRSGRDQRCASGCPSPPTPLPARGEREGPAPEAWEGEGQHKWTISPPNECSPRLRRQYLPRRRGVGSDLVFQLHKAGEFALGADEVDERDAQMASVEVAVDVEEMRLQPRHEAAHGRPQPD